MLHDDDRSSTPETQFDTGRTLVTDPSFRGQSGEVHDTGPSAWYTRLQHTSGEGSVEPQSSTQASLTTIRNPRGRNSTCSKPPLLQQATFTICSSAVGYMRLKVEPLTIRSAMMILGTPIFLAHGVCAPHHLGSTSLERPDACRASRFYWSTSAKAR
ncbi:hypothetical protein BDV95DRAFT_188585 [Massariosphaeria phaeospora]|uniref:Uncharacterized protein n=1 Tax=Massariosphaeria phaeospora TaxID=100035 RepID=A0A7C8I3L2_9PLEO|nr:hypothetical protein BDV95DRAFT_188585 [Massariosphaeria phaeospora]